MTKIKIKKGFRVPGTNIMVESGDTLSIKNKRKPMKEGGGAGVEIIFDDVYFTSDFEDKDSNFISPFYGNVKFKSYNDFRSSGDYSLEDELKGHLYINKADVLARMYDLVSSYPDEYGFDKDISKNVLKEYFESGRDTLEISTSNLSSSTPLSNTVFGAGFTRRVLSKDTYIQIEEVELNGEIYLDGELIEFDETELIVRGTVGFTEETCYAYGDLDTYDDED